MDKATGRRSARRPFAKDCRFCIALTLTCLRNDAEKVGRTDKSYLQYWYRELPRLLGETLCFHKRLVASSELDTFVEQGGWKDIEGLDDPKAG